MSLHQVSEAVTIDLDAIANITKTGFLTKDNTYLYSVSFKDTDEVVLVTQSQCKKIYLAGMDKKLIDKAYQELMEVINQ